MGFLSDIGDLLFGTQDEAQAKNEANVQKALGLLGDVDLKGLFGQAQGALGQGREDLQKGFGSALARVGTAGLGSALQALAREREAQGALMQSLQARGLGSSSGAARMGTGIRGETDRTLAGIESGVGQAQAGLLAGRGQALAGQSNQSANLWAQLANMELSRAQSQAGVLGDVQYEGSPGILGGLLGAGGAVLSTIGGPAGAAIGAGLSFLGSGSNN